LLLREHRFKFVAGIQTHVFTIDELVSGIAVWPNKFRLKVPASSNSEAKTFYGPSCYEVAEKAAQFMGQNTHQSVADRTTYSSQGSPASPSSELLIREAD